MVVRPTSLALSKFSTSRAWIARQFSDPYVKQRLTDPRGFRARSAFKLLEIDSAYNSFLRKRDVNVVVDLGAAPGGWSQVVAGKLGWEDDENATKMPRRGAYGYGENFAKHATRLGTWSSPRKPLLSGKHPSEEEDFDPLNIDNEEVDSPGGTGFGLIIAVDLLPIRPIRGVHTLQADFLSSEAELLIQGLMEAKGHSDGKVDVVLSDMAANLTGNVTRDTESSLDICHAVFEFAKRHLRSAEEIGRTRGGVLLMKHFVHPLLQEFYRDVLRPNFNHVTYLKPTSSRAESSEGYYLCQGWRNQV